MVDGESKWSPGHDYPIILVVIRRHGEVSEAVREETGGTVTHFLQVDRITAGAGREFYWRRGAVACERAAASVDRGKRPSTLYLTRDLLHSVRLGPGLVCRTGRPHSH